MFANSNKNIVLCHDYLKCKVTDAHYLVHALEIHTKNELKGSTYRTVAPTILGLIQERNSIGKNWSG